MDIAVASVLAVVLMVAATGFSRKLGVAAPLILVLAGLVLSYTPGVPPIEVPHEWILAGVLPPLLYAAAIKVPVIDFRRNFAAITSLSVVLVVVSAVISGLALHALLPDLNLAAAIALGAVISPPDAVAATSIGKRLGLPPRLVTVLEGEGLVNDATALVLLRSALAVAAGTMSGVWGGIADFAVAVVVAVIIGLVVGVLTIAVRSRFHDPVLDTSVSFVVPFLAFIPAEELGASGVLAVVVAGLYTGHRSASALDAQARISDSVNWRTVQFLLENAVFLLIGLELRHLVENIDESLLDIPHTVLFGLLITAALILVRFAWVFLLVFFLRWRAVHRARRNTLLGLSLLRAQHEDDPDPRRQRRRRAVQRIYARRRADVDEQRREGLEWKGAVVLGWSGMRGVVTLAAAQSLPETMPYREQLVLIAFVVAVTTLLLQGSTLPALIRVLGIRGADTVADLRASASLFETIADEGLKVLDSPAAVLGENVQVDPDVVERVRQDTFLRSESAWEQARAAQAGEDVPSPHRQYRALRLAVVDAERGALLAARSAGRYPSRILAAAQNVLDLEETRLRPRTGEH